MEIQKKCKIFFLNTLFPINCLSCEKENFWLCQRCAERIKLREFQVCPLCECQITPAGILCPLCRSKKESFLDSLIAATSYEIPAVKQLIHIFKYRFVADASKYLALLMQKAAIRNDLLLPDTIAPIPLHPRRHRWRGYNQSELLAQELAENLAIPLKIPVLDILERKKFNLPQMEIKNYRARLENVRNIFTLKNESAAKIKNKKVLLVDDIATTGATLQECAKVLKAHGAKKVMAIVVARQTIK